MRDSRAPHIEGRPAEWRRLCLAKQRWRQRPAPPGLWEKNQAHASPAACSVCSREWRRCRGPPTAAASRGKSAQLRQLAFDDERRRRGAATPRLAHL